MTRLEAKARVALTLNSIAVRLGGERWPWILERTVRTFWRKTDRSRAWPDFRRLVDLAPDQIWGGVGGDSYTGWIYQQGYFTALARTCTDRRSLRILDFGCGFGKLAPISAYLTHPEGQYIGVDIREDCIAFCRKQYSEVPRVSFFCSRDSNATYSDPEFARVPVPSRAFNDPAREGPKPASYGSDWPVPEGSLDIVVGVSVFTHLLEDDALGYMARIRKLLKPDGILIQSVLLIDEDSARSTHFDDPRLAEVHNFHTSLAPSHNFFTSSPKHPENAIAMNRAGLNTLLGEEFRLDRLLRGSVTGGHDGFPHDILIARKI